MCSINGTKVITVKRDKPIIGYRICAMFGMSGSYPPRLAPQYTHSHGNPWGRPQIAKAHRTVTVRGTMGLYARRTKQRAYNNAFTSWHVVVRVALWGRVVVGSDGYRAQYGKIIGIAPAHEYNDKALLRTIARRYGVPVLSGKKKDPPIVASSPSTAPAVALV